jgi:hypothetical protein
VPGNSSLRDEWLAEPELSRTKLKDRRKMGGREPPAAMDKLQSSAQTTDAKFLRTLLEINNAVISSLTQEALFRAIAGALRRIMPFDRTAIFLHDAHKEVLRLFILESSLPEDAGGREPRRLGVPRAALPDIP